MSWSMLECHQSATPATQNDMTACLETFNKDGFCSFPHRHCDGTTEASDSRRDMLEHENEHFVRDFHKIHNLQLQNQSFPTNFLANLARVFFWTYRKMDVLCKASVDFHDMLQNATPATQLAPCHHFPQRWHCNSQKTCTTTRLKCCACHAKWDRRCPKCCACHEKCNASSENVAKVLRLPHKTTFDASWNMLECHQSATPATQNDMTACLETFNKDGFCSFPHRHCDGTTEASDSRRDMLEHENEHFVRDFHKIHNLQLQNQSFPTNFDTNRKIDVSCEASVDFHHTSQNATPATEFAPCHHFAQHWQ